VEEGVRFPVAGAENHVAKKTNQLNQKREGKYGG